MLETWSKMNWSIPLVWLCFVTNISCAKLSNATFSMSQEEAFKPNDYQNYLTCLALCGKRHTARMNKTLLSGEQIADWIKTDLFDGCASFCEERENYEVASRLESLPPTDFERLEVTCIERESLNPLQVRAKINILHQHEFPFNSSVLFVVETWRSIAEEGGIIKNSLAGRHFTFSSQFMTPYTFKRNPNQENFYIRVFAFTSNGPIGKPLCSGAIALRSVLNALHRPLALALVQPRKVGLNLTSHFLQWTAKDELAPPECDQVLQLVMAQQVDTKTITLDSSHLVPIGELNENFTYKVKLSGTLAQKSNSDADSASILIIDSLREVESEDWTLKLDGYFGLLVMSCLIFLLLLIAICFFCCRSRRQRRSNYPPNIIHPKQAQHSYISNRTLDYNQSGGSDGHNEDTKTEETSVAVEQTKHVPPGLNYILNAQEIANCFGASFPFQPADENLRVPSRPFPVRSMLNRNVYQINNTSTPNDKIPRLSPPFEDIV